jgi:hypothetical protein
LLIVAEFESILEIPHFFFQPGYSDHPEMMRELSKNSSNLAGIFLPGIIFS